MQMNDIGFGKFGQCCTEYDVNGKQVMFLEVVGLPNNNTLQMNSHTLPP